MSIMKLTRLFPLALMLAMLLAACGQSDAPEQAAATPAPGATAAALPVSRAAETGRVAAEGQLVPLEAADLAFQTGGVVAEVLASEGQAVVAGEALIRLDDAAIQALVAQAQAGVDAAAAGLAAAQSQATLAATQQQTAEAGVAAAEAQLALVQAGARPEQVAAAERALAAAEAGVAQAAAQRDAATGVSEAQVRAAEARLAAARSQLTALQETYDTLLTCVDLPDGRQVCPGLGAPEENVRAQLQAAEASYSAAQLAVDEARAGATDAGRQSAGAGVAVAVAQRDVAAAQLALLQAGPRPEQVRLAEIGVEQARLGLTRAGVALEQANAAAAQAEAGVKNAEAALEEAENALGRLTLTAPFTGTVGDVLVEVGELVSPGVPVAQLADISRWVVETGDLVELDVVYLEPGQVAEVTLDALPGETLRGTVTDIGRVPQVARGDVTYPVRIALDDYPNLPLRWGMTTLVSIDTN